VGAFPLSPGGGQAQKDAIRELLSSAIGAVAKDQLYNEEKAYF
jgi:hypothetical protein